MDFNTELDTSHAKSLHEDPMVTIQRRIEEVKLMTRNRSQSGKGLLSWLPPERVDYVMIMKDMPINQLRKTKRKGWKLASYIRWVAKMMKILIPVFVRSKLYYFDMEAKKQSAQAQQLDGKFTRIRCSLGSELHFALITAPRYRSPYMIKKIKWLLKATKAFTHLFPAEMETEVARHVGYEAYDDGRIIAHQSRKPDRFYFIVTGRVSIMQQYQLSTGKVTKSLGMLNKGMTSDAEEMEKQWIRTHSLVAKGKVEVLIIERKDFVFLQKTNQGPPVEFLKSINLFGEFPLEKMNEFPESTEYKYYAQGKVIVHDSNRTPFIHVIKSGQVRVIRFQTVYNAGLCNSRAFNSRTKEGIGCGKTFSHATAMIGKTVPDRKSKRKKLQITLPRLRTWPEGFTTTTTISTQPTNPHIQTLGVEISLQTGVGLDRSSTPLIYRSKTTSHMSGSERSFYDDVRTPAVITINGPNESLAGSDLEQDHQEVLQRSESRVLSSTNRKQLQLNCKSLDQSGQSQKNADSFEVFKPHGLWMTREKTGATENPHKTSKHQRHHTFHGGVTTNQGDLNTNSDLNYYRKAYLQLDLLNPGDIFGLDHMQNAKASEGQGVSLLSDGAEVVRVNKRFFIQHAGNNTMLKLDTLHKEYIGRMEARQALYEKETWAQYKHAIWNKLTAKLPKIAYG